MGHSYDIYVLITLVSGAPYLYIHHDSLSDLVETDLQPRRLPLLASGGAFLLHLFRRRVEMWCDFSAIAILKGGGDRRLYGGDRRLW